MATLAAQRLVLGEVVPWWVPLAVSLCLTAAGVGLLWHQRRPRGLVLLVGACLAVGACTGRLAGWEGERFAVDMEAAEVSEWEMCVQTDSSLGTYGYSCRATARREGSPEGTVTLRTSEPLRVGDVVVCGGSFTPSAGDEWGRSQRARGVWGTVRARTVMEVLEGNGARGAICRVRNLVLDSIQPASGEERALLAGVTCGSREGISALGMSDLFSTCGVSHLVAVSGSHLAILSALVGAWMGVLPLGVRARGLLQLLLSLAFVLFCGAPVSAVRSWAMVAVALGSLAFGRRSHTLSAVSVVALVLEVTDPCLTGDLGFLLSCSSVIGLCLLAPYAGYCVDVLVPRRRLPRRVPAVVRRALGKVGDGVREGLAATLVAQLSTLPVTIGAFGEVSLVSPLANCLASPLLAPLVALGLLAACLAWAPHAQAIVLAACDLLARVMLSVLSLCSSVPFASVPASGGAMPIASASALVLLVLFWPRISRRALARLLVPATCLALAFVLRGTLLAPARVCVLDVGQGDAILVQDGPHAVLVDAGPDGSVASQLLRLGVLRLDAVILTHTHEDHVGGLSELSGLVSCDAVVVAEGVAEAMPDSLMQDVLGLCGDGLVEVGLGDVLEVGGFSLRVVHPEAEVEGDENADSLELLLTYERGQRTLTGLLTGDGEKDELQEILDSGLVGDIDFLKVGHHGSAVSVGAGQALALDPEVSVASAGEGNDYGHPRDECVEALEGAGSLFLCTKDVGTVEVRPGRDGPVVSYDGARLF